MKTINIKGKEYVPVVERVKEFHRLYPLGDINTEIVTNDEKHVVVKATVTVRQSRPDYKAPETVTGVYLDSGLSYQTFVAHSQAEWGKGMMGAVALEVAETSAIGRALGFANIGLIDGIASADEIRKAGTDDATVPYPTEPPEFNEKVIRLMKK